MKPILFLLVIASLNSDGIDELLMTSGDTHQGVVEEMASLLSFQNGL
jgi:hypothetical protein